MPTPPYVKMLVTVNAGAPASGYAGDVPSAAVLALTPESTAGWENIRHEIFGYPEGWPTPAGWTLEASGLIVSTDYTPAAITLESSFVRWGKWLGRSKLNGRLKGGIVNHPDTLDETWGWDIPSPAFGLRELGSGEGAQVDPFRNWTKDVNRNHKALEGGTVGDGVKRDQTPDATPKVVATLAIPDNAAVMVQAFCVGKKPATATTAFLAYQRLFERNGGGAATAIAAATDLGTVLNGTGWALDIAGNGNNVEVRVTGEAATVNWNLEVKILLNKDTP